MSQTQFTINVEQSGIVFLYVHGGSSPVVPHSEFIKTYIKKGCQKTGVTLSLSETITLLPLFIESYLAFLSTYHPCVRINKYKLIETVKAELIHDAQQGSSVPLQIKEFLSECELLELLRVAV